MPSGGIEPPHPVPKTGTLSIKLRGQIYPNFDIIVANMQSIDEQIEAIQEILRKTPHHKATNAFIGAMRAKIARLNDKKIESSSHSGGGGGYGVKKQGDATVVLVGPPSAGKSTLINQLTNAESKVAPYSFTTVNVVPGMLKYKEAYIQILDIPGLIEGASKGKGRGREVLSVARAADLLIVMTDVERLDLIEKMVLELTNAGIRINQEKPNILIEKRIDGGLEIASNFRQEIDKETIREIAHEYGIKNGIITLKEKVSLERLFDAFSGNRVYIPALFVVNKIDSLKNLRINENYIPISAEKKIGLDNLIEQIWRALKFLTVYLVENGEEPNYQNPIVVKQGDTLKDVALRIGSDFLENKKIAKIWGNGAKFSGQEVSLLTEVKEGMQIRFQ